MYMIASLAGTLVRKDPSDILVETSGVGYQIYIPVSTLTVLPEVGEDVRLHTFQYVREDTLALYGFATQAERRLFSELLGVSGIGPKVALAILSVASPNDIRAAISAGDTEFITSVPGIGKKTAERVVVDLRDKMDMLTETGESRGNDEVAEALVGLGYSRSEARRAVQQVASDATETDEMLKEALKTLAK